MADSRYHVPYLPVGSAAEPEEIDAVVRVLRSGEKLSCGSERDAFEAEFAAYTGADHALSLTNATVALELATYLINLEPGDEVVATPQTYQANLTPLLGSRVVVKFCDIDPETLNVQPESFSALVGERTRALFLVHHGGTPADMSPIMEVANMSGIKVVEDCAHALGAKYDGRSPGTLGHYGCWSFQSYKNINTLGEGGMITLADPREADRVARIRAIEPDADFVPLEAPPLVGHDVPVDTIERHAKNAYTEDCTVIRHPGTNSTLSEPAAAFGRVQLQKLDKLVARRRDIADQLDTALGTLPELRVQPRRPGVDSSHHLYSFFVRAGSGLDRDRLMRHLDDAGVQIQLRYFPIHLLPEWRSLGHGLGECPTAERVWFHEQVNLPIYPQLEQWQIDFMIESVARAVAEQAG